MTEYPCTRRFWGGAWMFGRFVGRYAADGYGPEVSLPDAIRPAPNAKGLEPLGLNRRHFWGDATLADGRSALEDTGLAMVAVAPEIYTQEFRLGALASPNAGTRRRACHPIARATEVAVELGTQ